MSFLKKIAHLFWPFSILSDFAYCIFTGSCKSLANLMRWRPQLYLVHCGGCRGMGRGSFWVMGKIILLPDCGTSASQRTRYLKGVADLSAPTSKFITSPLCCSWKEPPPLPSKAGCVACQGTDILGRAGQVQVVLSKNKFSKWKIWFVTEQKNLPWKFSASFKHDWSIQVEMENQHISDFQAGGFVSPAKLQN